MGSHNHNLLPTNSCTRCGAWRGELGMEPTPELFVQHITQIFREVRRVLRNDGTLWLNFGDSYIAGKGQSGSGGAKHQEERAQRGASINRGHQTLGGKKQMRPTDDLPAINRAKRGDARWGGGNAIGNGVLKPKDMAGIPWRVAFALQADGWYLRSDIIWSKPNPMPESVEDRPTRSHEYIFLLAKSEKYFYDHAAIFEPLAASTLPRYGRATGINKWTAGVPGQTAHSMNKARPNVKDIRAFMPPIGGVKHVGRNGNATYSGNRPRWNLDGRNRRSVWEITTKSFKGSHFATFPPTLPELCIKAGTSEKGCCLTCGAPWKRIITVTRPQGYMESYADIDNAYLNALPERGGWKPRKLRAIFKNSLGSSRTTTGWQPTCECDGILWYYWTMNDDGEMEKTASPEYIPNNKTMPMPIPCLVLDPFAGSGTTCVVAKRLHRSYCGIELNEIYVKELILPRVEQFGIFTRNDNPEKDSTTDSTIAA